MPVINPFATEIKMQIKYKPSIVNTIRENENAVSLETRQLKYYENENAVSPKTRQ